MARKLALLCLAISAFSSASFAALKVGDPYPNQCWQDQNGKKSCLHDYQSTVRALLFNAGF